MDQDVGIAAARGLPETPRDAHCQYPLSMDGTHLGYFRLFAAFHKSVFYALSLTGHHAIAEHEKEIDRIICGHRRIFHGDCPLKPAAATFAFAGFFIAHQYKVGMAIIGRIWPASPAAGISFSQTGFALEMPETQSANDIHGKVIRQLCERFHGEAAVMSPTVKQIAATGTNNLIRPEVLVAGHGSQKDASSLQDTSHLGQCEFPLFCGQVFQHFGNHHAMTCLIRQRNMFDKAQMSLHVPGFQFRQGLSIGVQRVDFPRLPNCQPLEIAASNSDVQNHGTFKRTPLVDLPDKEFQTWLRRIENSVALFW